MMVTKVTLPNAVMLGEVANLLREGHRVVIMTKGNSMLPLIRGDRDSVNLELRACIQPGDIVLAEIAPGHYVLHRVVAIRDGMLTLHGDGNLRGTETCRISDVVGTAIEVIRPDGKVQNCTSGRSRRWARIWNALPVTVRRLFLAIYRRLI